MKKILSVLLAIMMLFGALAISSSAALESDTQALKAIEDLYGTTADNGKPYVVILYMIGEGKYAEPVDLFNGTTFEDSDNPGAMFYRIPTTANEMYIGARFRPYSVAAPEGKDFDYWECLENGEVYHPTRHVPITQDMADERGVITLVASYSTAAGTEDTLTMIMNILIKVFGAIVGILFYNGDTQAGAALLEQMIGGIL